MANSDIQILSRRQRINRETLARRKRENSRSAAYPRKPEGKCLLPNDPDYPSHSENLHADELGATSVDLRVNIVDHFANLVFWTIAALERSLLG